MNLMEMVLNNTDLLKQVGGQIGLDDNKTKDALDAILPSINRGIQNNARKPGGLEELLNTINKGGHDKYVDDLSKLNRPETTADGNNILGHIFGNKDVSRNVAEAASRDCGIDGGILKKLLPIAASIVMGSLGKSTGSGGILGDLLGQVLGGGKDPEPKPKGGLGGLLGGIFGGVLGGNKNKQPGSIPDGLGSLEDFLQTGTKKSTTDLDDILNLAKKFI